MRVMALVLTAAALAACTSSGRPIDHVKADAFVPGRTTYAEVIAALGPPNSMMTSAGVRTIAYSHLTVQTNPATFIPVVGLFAGGSQVTSDTVSFSFDQNNIMTNTTALSGGNSSSVGRSRDRRCRAARQFRHEKGCRLTTNQTAMEALWAADEETRIALLSLPFLEIAAHLDTPIVMLRLIRACERLAKRQPYRRSFRQRLTLVQRRWRYSPFTEAKRRKCETAGR
jgi:hypothetical protein